MRGLRHQHDFAVVDVLHHRLVGTRSLGERQLLLDNRLQRAVAQPLHECRVDADELGPYATRSKMVILRVEGSTVKRIPCNYNKVVAAEVEPESFFLQPGDTLVVP